MAVSLGQEEVEQWEWGHMTGCDLQEWEGPLWLPGERMEGREGKEGALNPMEESGSTEGATWMGSLGFPLADWGVGAIPS